MRKFSGRIPGDNGNDSSSFETASKKKVRQVVRMRKHNQLCGGHFIVCRVLVCVGSCLVFLRWKGGESNYGLVMN